MSRLLIDLTDLELWNGNHGGTQRAVYNISKYLYLEDKDPGRTIGFIAFSSRDNAFYPTEFDPIMDRVEAQRTAQAIPHSPGLSRKARLKSRLRPYVPESVRKNPKLRRAALKSLSTGIHLTRNVRSTTRAWRPGARPASSKPVVFQKDDTVLIMGKPWDNPKIQAALAKQKSAAGFKLVQVVYDLIIPLQPQLHHPSLFAPYTRNMFEAVSNSDLLLPISKCSAHDLKDFAKRLNLPAPKLKVIRLGDEIVNDPEADFAKPDDRIASNFIACVGTVEIRKNHMLLYYAYKLALQQGADLPQLLIVGGRGWLSGDFQHLVDTDPALKDKIVILDNINDASLSWVYGHCLFTVYPSMYEGWGLPVAESISYGKVCVASNSSSIPEIAGDLIDYFSPYDAADCLNKMLEYLDQGKLDAKQAHLTANYKPTAWRDTAIQVRAAIESLS